MANELKPETIDFGILIAFVAPGFVGFAGLAHASEVAGKWMSAAPEKQDVGVFLFVLLASLALGLGISGARALFVDMILFAACAWRWSVPAPTVDWAKVTDNAKLASVYAARDNFYRYFQFYGNMAVALLVWAATRGIANVVKHGELAASDRFLIPAALVACVLLLASARDSAQRYSTALEAQGVRKDDR